MSEGVQPEFIISPQPDAGLVCRLCSQAADQPAQSCGLAPALAPLFSSGEPRLVEKGGSEGSYMTRCGGGRRRALKGWGLWRCGT